MNWTPFSGSRTRWAAEELADGGFQLVHAGRRGGPDDLQRRTEVAVRQDVAHPAHVAPLDLRRSSNDVVGDVLRRLADDLDVPHHRVLRALVGDEGLEGHPGNEPANLAARLADVRGVEPP